MKNIVLTRIDDRLIHGQVMTAWIQYTQANEVVIVDDQVAKDSFMQMVMKSSMPAKINLTILDVQGAIEYFLSKAEAVDKKYFILIKTPFIALSLVKAKVNLKKLCIGGMGARSDRLPFYRNISASKEEKECLIELSKLGVDVFAQVLTDNHPVSLSQIIQVGL